MNFNAYDIAYGFGVGLSSPFWLAKPSARRKVLRAFRERMGDGFGRREGGGQAVMIHAVSLGEINATRALVELLRRHQPELHVIISTTTDTGFQRGAQLYADQENVTLIRYPLDFTAAIERTLDALRPDVVVLMELELWPNFVRECARRKIAVMLANGRITPSSFRRYKLIKPVMSTMLSRLSRICVQDDLYAQRFLSLGAPASRVRIAGTMKFDNAQVADRVEGDEQLAHEVGLLPGREAIWVCGSTGPGEEEILLGQYRQLLAQFKRLRLALIPRKPERFDEVASMIESFRFKVVRRSRRGEPIPPPEEPVPPVVLGDTMGELRKFYSIADVVFVGRSLVDLGPRQHGSDMIEPAALGKPVIIGPYTANFAEAVRRFLAEEAMLEVADEEMLTQAVRVLLSTPAEAQAMGNRAREIVAREQGATARHAEEILALLHARPRRRA